MKICFLILIILLQFSLLAKEEMAKILEGNVSYISSQNIYVKFENTDGIEIGDTLFFKEKNSFIPAVKVDHKSSTSCAGVSITTKKIELNSSLFAFVTIKKMRRSCRLF